jgi:two-component system response regulator NreC
MKVMRAARTPSSSAREIGKFVKDRVAAPSLSKPITAGSPQKTKVLICDDHTLFREGIRAILTSDPAVNVVGEASDGRQAVEQAHRLRPDVILMDVSMPAMIGYEAIRRIVQTNQQARILVLTMYEEEEIIRRCLRAGAAGYIVKDAPAAQLLEAVHTVSEGGRYLSPRVLKKVVDDFAGENQPTETKYDTLSSREREVLKLLAEGLSVKDVAAALNLSVKTAEAHKYNLMKKLDLHDRTGLIKYALSRKLIAFPEITASLPDIE